MSLQFAFGEVGETVDLNSYYENQLLKENYGFFEITERAGELQLDHK